jgi:hypothetical protein
MVARTRNSVQIDDDLADIVVPFIRRKVDIVSAGLVEDDLFVIA